MEELSIFLRWLEFHSIESMVTHEWEELDHMVVAYFTIIEDAAYWRFSETESGKHYLEHFDRRCGITIDASINEYSFRCLRLCTHSNQKL